MIVSSTARRPGRPADGGVPRALQAAAAGQDRPARLQSIVGVPPSEQQRTFHLREWVRWYNYINRLTTLVGTG